MAMPGWLSKIIGAGVGATAEQIGNVVAKVSEGHLGKREMNLEIERLLNLREVAVAEQITAIIQAKERVIIAELQQEDKMTKRARPSVIYSGPVLAFILIVMHYIGHFTGQSIPPPDGIEWFVSAWAAAFSTYAIGRSAEKRGIKNKLTRAITGGPSSMLD